MRQILVLAALAASLAISACHTVAGAGRDVSSVGHTVTDTAHDATPH
ncbi:MAG TPA: entericidin A/B family lipoprotein [Caulobacteraceae bacterium]|jgi:predicted small secreted protein|nr:entericidin A/B family lipoprotein [Caulobacteraceae bacterium]